MTDNPTPNDIALLREANYALLRDQLYSLTDGLDMSVEQEDHFRGRVRCYLAMHEAALAPGQHDGAAGEGQPVPKGHELPTIPAGMKPWAGGDSAPADWDGGIVLLREAGLVSPGPLFWGREGGANAFDIIAYTPKPSTEQAGTSWWSEAWTVGSKVRFSSGMTGHTGHMCAPVSITSAPHVAAPFWVNAENAKKAVAMLEAAYAAGLANGLNAAVGDRL